MAKSPRLDNDELLRAGLELMERNNRPLTKLASTGRSMQYSLPNGETVRVRTCNDHILIVIADRPTNDAKLNIEGTDWLLIVMPEVERTPGNILAYLLPTRVVVEAARTTHQRWLSTNPNTKGGNTTWNLWFDPRGPAAANDFAKKWQEYRLKDPGEYRTGPLSGPSDVKLEVEEARRRISKVAGVPQSAVRITIDFGA